MLFRKRQVLNYNNLEKQLLVSPQGLDIRVHSLIPKNGLEIKEEVIKIIMNKEVVAKKVNNQVIMMKKCKHKRQY